jgi:hypothetical protein
MESENINIEELMKLHGVNPNAGLNENIKNLEDCKDEEEYYAQFRGDYIDLKDFIQAETYEDKKEFLKKLSKNRVILIREHILCVWTFNPEKREELEEQLEALQLIIYSDKEELGKMESIINEKKNEELINSN